MTSDAVTTLPERVVPDVERAVELRTVRPGVPVIVGGAELRLWLEAHERDTAGLTCYVLSLASASTTTRVRISARSAAEFLWVEEERVADWLATVELHGTTA